MKKIKTNLRFIIPLTLAIIIIIASIIYLKRNQNDTLNSTITSQQVLEQQLLEISGMSKIDAFELIKPMLDEANYTYTVEATTDNLYKIVVLTSYDNKENIYYVDPTNSKVYIDIDSKDER